MRALDILRAQSKHGKRHGVTYIDYRMNGILKIMLIVCVNQVINGLNQLPSYNVLSTTVSPLIMITGISGPDYRQVKKIGIM